jgi:hypothetical protein
LSPDFLLCFQAEKQMHLYYVSIPEIREEIWWTKYVLLHALRTNATTTGVRGDNNANTENKQIEEAHQIFE